jgi:hypothetical protein
MKIISHRGNLYGSGDSNLENSVVQIELALEHGFDVEVDIWRTDDDLWLGHDFPQYHLFKKELLDDLRVWFHAKNLEALHYMCLYHPKSNFFWHQSDDFTLTSSGKIWTYPEKSLCRESIIVALDYDQIDFAIQYPIYGICTDDPIYVRENLKEKPGIENRYSTYVELSMMESTSPISFGEFMEKLSDENICEYCIILKDTICECKTKT